MTPNGDRSSTLSDLSNLSEKMIDYDPNGVGSKAANLFGLPFTPDEAKVVVLPVPWEVTVSYGAGTAQGPAAVMDASTQLDLFDPEGIRIWEIGAAMPDVDLGWQEKSESLRQRASDYILSLETMPSAEAEAQWSPLIAEINEASIALNSWVEQEAAHYLSQEKLVGVLGGDHSAPLGLMQALAKQYSEYSILQIDAHADLRVAYEGFTFSHASIMDNALKLPQVSRLVQVGIRDLSPAEADRIQQSNGRIHTFFDWTLKDRQFAGSSWHQTCESIISCLSDRVYVSFDIDGLNPALCPHTGTPVPGGLLFEEATYLLKCLANSGKHIIGFDLCEVAPGDNDWDGNVGARILYRIISAMLKSQALSPVS